MEDNDDDQQQQDAENEDQDEDDDEDDGVPCVPPPPPPTANATIDGTVFEAIAGQPGLVNWVVDLSGGATATALTDATGHYAFTGLAPGTYTICEQVQVGFLQTFPPSGPACPTGIGYTFTLADGTVASFVDFGNARQ